MKPHNKILSVVFIAIFLVGLAAYTPSMKPTINSSQQPITSEDPQQGPLNALLNGGFEDPPSGSGYAWAPRNWTHGGDSNCDNTYLSTDSYEGQYSYCMRLLSTGAWAGFNYVYQEVGNPGTLAFAVKLVTAPDSWSSVEVSIRDLSANPDKELIYEFSPSDTQSRGLPADGWWVDHYMRVIHEKLTPAMGWIYETKDWKTDWNAKWGEEPVSCHTWRINLCVDNYNWANPMEARFDKVSLTYERPRGSINIYVLDISTASHSCVGSTSDVRQGVINAINDARVYTKVKLAGESWNLELVTSMDRLQYLVEQPSTCIGSVFINTHGEVLPIPSDYLNGDNTLKGDYDWIKAIARNCNESGWIWANVAGYPFYYVSNTNKIGSSPLAIGQIGLQKFLTKETSFACQNFDKDNAYRNYDFENLHGFKDTYRRIPPQLIGSNPNYLKDDHPIAANAGLRWDLLGYVASDGSHVASAIVMAKIIEDKETVPGIFIHDGFSNDINGVDGVNHVDDELKGYIAAAMAIEEARAMITRGAILSQLVVSNTHIATYAVSMRPGDYGIGYETDGRHYYYVNIMFVIGAYYQEESHFIDYNYLSYTDFDFRGRDTDPKVGFSILTEKCGVDDVSANDEFNNRLAWFIIGAVAGAITYHHIGVFLGAAIGLIPLLQGQWNSESHNYDGSHAWMYGHGNAHDGDGKETVEEKVQVKFYGTEGQGLTNYGFQTTVKSFVALDHLFTHDSRKYQLWFSSGLSFDVNWNEPQDSTNPTFTSTPGTVAQNPGWTFDLTWTAQDLESGPSNYEIKLGTTVLQSNFWTTNNQAFTYSGSQSAPGTYTYTCTVYDAFGNSASDSATVNVQNAVVNSVTVTTHDGVTHYDVYEGHANVRFDVDVSASNYNPAHPNNKVQVGYNDQWSPATYSSTIGPHYYYTCTLSLASANPPATYTIKARASTDDGVTWSTSSPITVYIHYIPPVPPTVSITSPSADQTFYTIGDSMPITVHVTATTSDSHYPVTSVDIYVDGTWYSATSEGSNSWYRTFTMSSSSYPGTRHYISARATNAGGTQSTSQISVYIVKDKWNGKTIPSGHNYNFYGFTSLYGESYHVDTAGYSGDSAFTFLGYSVASYTVGPDGAIRVQGYFRQYDTFYGGLEVGRRVTSLYVMYSSNPNTIVKNVVILDYTDGIDWKYRDVVISGLTPGSSVTIGVGRWDSWDYDWSLTAEWAAVQVSTITLGWTGRTSPTGHSMHSNAITLEGLPGWHVDTKGYYDYGFDFYAYASQNFVVGQNGKIHVTGYFRQYDTFSGGLENGRRVERIYVLDPNNPSTIIKSVLVLQYSDGTGWVYKDITIDGLTSGSTVKIGVGRGDQWSADWQLTAEWSGLSIVPS